MIAACGAVKLEKGDGGLEALRITNGAATARVYLLGATVTDFQPTGQKPVIFVSSEAIYQEGKAIRGGIPICWPWFGPKWDDPKAPQHGLVRAKIWDVESVRELNPSLTEVVLTTSAGELLARFKLTVGQSLSVELESINNGRTSVRVEEALHTYLAVGDSRQVTIDGLARATYIDKTDQGAHKEQGSKPIRFTAETDRVYLDTEATCVLTDPVMKRKITVAKSGSKSTVVWNPWIDKSKALTDFGDDEWQRMCCIETANAADNHVMLSAGESHLISTTISVA